MALSKELAYGKTGVVTTYHKIEMVSLHGSRLDCVVTSYLSAEVRQGGSNLSRQHFSFEITVEEEESMGIRQLAYKKIKELPEWADAEDC